MKALTDLYSKQWFKLKREIVPFVGKCNVYSQLTTDSHWSLLWSREKPKNWVQTIGMTLSKYTDLFENGINELGSNGNLLYLNYTHASKDIGE
jgi:hypothetical protein